MTRRLLLLALLLFTGNAAAVTPVILVVGDSLSAGYGIALRSAWPALLQQRLDHQGYLYHVVNASISGDTTSSGRERLPAALERHHPEIVIIELGANDGLRGLPLTEMRANLSAMIAMVLHDGARVLLIGMYLPTNYGKAYADAFHRVYGDLARQYHVPLVPFLLQGVALEPRLMQSDGLHPRSDGEPRVFDNVWHVLEPMLHGRPTARAMKDFTDSRGFRSAVPLNADRICWRRSSSRKSDPEKMVSSPPCHTSVSAWFRPLVLHRPGQVDPKGTGSMQWPIGIAQQLPG
ncbi:MAG: arylesterase [Acidiferrobacterales bacterium]